jgi:hypothetical protein
MRGALSPMPLEQLGSGMKHERQDGAVALRDVERSLEGALGGACVSERVV